LSVTAVYSLWPTLQPATPLQHRRISSVDFHGTPLDEAIVQLAAAAGVKVTIDRDALIAAKVDLKAPVFLRLRDVELRVAFTRLDINYDRNLVLEPHGGGLRVATDRAAPAAVRLYDVGDLLSRWQSSRYTMKIQRPFRIDGAPNVPPDPPPALMTRQELMEDLIGVIIHMDRPNQWFANNGLFAGRGSPGDPTIMSMGDRILVSAPPWLHGEVEDFLHQLRQADAALPKPAPMPAKRKGAGALQ
jgi:hypothetical protein